MNNTIFWLLKRITTGAVVLLAGMVTVSAQTWESELYGLSLTKITSGLDHPWGMVLLPVDNSILVTERKGNLRWWHKGKLSKPVSGVPKVLASGQGGLLDVALHPNFLSNGVIYLSYSKPVGNGATTAVARAIFDNKQLVLIDVRDIFVAKPARSTSHHYGSRLVFGSDDLLYFSVGDRGGDDLAQDTSTHMGSIIRITGDGAVPKDNPLLNTPGALPEIFSYGHRNPQGMLWNRQTDSLWIHEHGPRGGDEINQIRAGANYGWPVITHGKAYSGFSIGEGTSKPGLEQPLWHWTPSIAPSGMAIYSGDMFPKWRGNTLVGSLKFAYLERLVWEDGKVSHREKLLDRAIGRVRDVRQAADGSLYLLNDQGDGAIYRLSPAN